MSSVDHTKVGFLVQILSSKHPDIAIEGNWMKSEEGLSVYLCNFLWTCISKENIC